MARTELGESEREVKVMTEDAELDGILGIPSEAEAIVLFAHGSGSSRHSPRNQFVARQLREAGLATLLFDLLTAGEDEVDRITREHRFDIPLLAGRLRGATDWVTSQSEAQGMALGYFGASTGSAAALIAAADKPNAVDAVVSRGGRPDLAGEALSRVKAPSLFIVGGRDVQVLELNRRAMGDMNAEKELKIVEGATHLFEEPGALEKVAELARDWFRGKLVG